MAGAAGSPTIGTMVGEVTGFLHIVRIEASIYPVNAEYSLAFAPLGGRRHARHTCIFFRCGRYPNWVNLSHTAVVAFRAPRLAARKPARSHRGARGTQLAVTEKSGEGQSCESLRH
jgi:hypothetical protein